MRTTLRRKYPLTISQCRVLWLQLAQLVRRLLSSSFCRSCQPTATAFPLPLCISEPSVSDLVQTPMLTCWEQKISTYGYIMQRYTSVAASALVSNTFTRYVVAGSIVVVSIPMFENLGVHHVLTIFASISCAFTPVPFFLYFNAKRSVNKAVAVPAHQ